MDVGGCQDSGVHATHTQSSRAPSYHQHTALCILLLQKSPCFVDTVQPPYHSIPQHKHTEIQEQEQRTTRITIIMAPPKTVLDKIIHAIREQPHTSPNGISRVAITKYLKQELDYDNGSALKKALKQGVSKGKLIQTGQSFRVAGDPLPDLPAEPTVEHTDVKVGKGPAAVAGDTVVVKYQGTLAADGSEFDAANSFEFVLGNKDVIKGWDLGIAGMQVGGQRRLQVPAKLAYGKRGSAPNIPPNADLNFVVTLKKIK